ncbi:TPA: transketolase [candidate division WOR-3 bacterium]|uniref:Transketolase n=1 Tax=candidate division WOR-3 bacterium TaxID=2052148 RepID=A0A350HC78_UNCW3|nr:transketolase [candidate division WOR-3 bacterium]
MKKDFLIQRSNECRKEILKMVYNASSGHIGGAFSAIDIMVYLYFEKMNFSKNNFTDINRDRFILSKGHASAALYSCLAFKEIISFEELSGFRKIDRMLQGHPSRKTTPGVETSTGSLGQGLSFANGCALGLKIKNINSKTYCMVGDGEINEGQFWEALMTSARYRLENLRVILDYNHLQIDGKIEEIKNPSPSRERFESFGFYVIEINGHNFDEIEKAFTEADLIKGMPVFIIAHTTKGKGVSFMENNVDFHGTPPKKDEFERAMKELENA